MTIKFSNLDAANHRHDIFVTSGQCSGDCLHGRKALTPTIQGGPKDWDLTVVHDYTEDRNSPYSDAGRIFYKTIDSEDRDVHSGLKAEEIHPFLVALNPANMGQVSEKVVEQFQFKLQYIDNSPEHTLYAGRTAEEVIQQAITALGLNQRKAEQLRTSGITDYDTYEMWIVDSSKKMEVEQLPDPSGQHGMCAHDADSFCEECYIESDDPGWIADIHAKDPAPTNQSDRCGCGKPALEGTDICLEHLREEHEMEHRAEAGPVSYDPEAQDEMDREDSEGKSFEDALKAADAYQPAYTEEAPADETPVDPEGDRAILDSPKDFMLLGNARITLLNTDTGTRFTYRVRLANKRRGDPEGTPRPWFVSVLTGSNNENDYQFFGTIFPDSMEFKYSFRASIGRDAKSVQVFAWVWENIDSLPSNVQSWHEGKCGMCAKPLTDPESIARGIGPICAAKGE